MRRVQIQFTDEQARALLELARAQERPVAALVRAAVVEWLGHTPSNGRPQEREAAQAPGKIDVVSIAEIARRTDRSVNTVQSWRRRYSSFPQPIARLATGPVWNWSDVELWLADRDAGRIGDARRPMIRADLPGAELVRRGLDDLAAGRESAESLLLKSARKRLAAVGIRLTGEVDHDAAERLYGRLAEELGDGAAHARYNALRRRLVSFLNSRGPGHAAAG